MARAARVAAAVSCSCNGGDILRCLTHKLETKTHEETENGWVGWVGGQVGADLQHEQYEAPAAEEVCGCGVYDGRQLRLHLFDPADSTRGRVV